MLKHLNWMAVFSTMFVLVLPGIASGDTPPRFAYPLESGGDSESICYMRMADGRTLNLTRLCGGTVPNQQQLGAIGTSSSSTISTPNPVPNMIPGRVNSNAEGQCFLFDAQGNPCPTIQ